MSYDTNLHRTFDYQLSPAPLRIIDWAPVKAVARSVFQPGQGAKEFTLVNDATSNASSVAAAYAQQENQRRVHESRESSASLSTPAATADAAAPAGPLSAIGELAASEFPGLSAASPAVAVPATAVLVNGSGTGTPAAVMDSAQRPRTSSPLVAPPLLAKGVSQYGAAGMMYGFDAVYHKDSFGVLAGLFTGVGYHQVNTHYRQELPAAPRRTEPAKGEHGGWAGTLGTAARTSPVVVTSAVPTPRSGSTTRVAANRSSSESGPSGAVDAAVVPGAVELQAAENSAPSPPPTLQPRLEQVIASQRHGQLQVYNALQAFWYWGARRWTGVLNVRVTPLPSGDALLPVCEYVARTVMTECSLVIDDPVVYLHGFVVMLGRRARAAEELGSGHSTGTAVVGAEVQSCNELCRAGSRHPLEAVAAASLADEAIGTAITGAQHHPAEGTGHLSHKHRSPPTACTVAASDHAHNAARYGVAVPPDAAAVDNAGGAPLPEWLYWYQRCALETTDEWLWNRAASEVADDAARSATPWWKPRHIKMGVGLALRYRKPRGVNVYWGWSARVGRGMHLSGHIDVLRRMSCAVSSTFGFLDVSVRLRVNLVTLHQTALDAGVCWRPMPQVPEFAVRLATSANGTTLGVEVADVAPTLYGPVIARLSDWRSRRHHAEATEPCKGIGGSGEDCVAGSDQSSVSGGAPTGVADGSREDLVGLLPITWHYLQSTGSTITSAFTSVKGALTNTLASVSSASSGAGSSCGGGNAANTPAAQGSVSDVRRRPALLSATPTLTTPATSPTLPVGHKLSRVVLPAGKASLRYARNAWHALADLGWLENMLSISHVNVSMGVTSEPSNRHREWSLFLIISEK
ncbi:hypothetical protein CGC21_24740 [Leishmania donovani]|uniref:Uncharacterized protein n=1 Tax=Leishmania donovani TaxID=5661 RepID=A0A504XQY7_LEIDO|nr:hypothetical protein CGC21_24740 [Leishmania donovani]